VINDEHKAVVRDTWRLVVPIADTAADLFYQRLFELKPEYRGLFSKDMRDQKRKLVAMLSFIVKSLDFADDAWRESVPEEDDLFLVVLALGRRHTDLYKVPDEAYAAVLEAILWTLDYGLGKAFTDRARTTWTLVFTLIATTMKMGRLAVEQARSASTAPPPAPAAGAPGAAPAPAPAPAAGAPAPPHLNNQGKS
jgi:hemoglobin-like flavoprotein